MLGGLMRIVICLAIGTAFGWFASAEYEKNKEPIKPIPLPLPYPGKADFQKKIITKDDIRVVDWRGKK